MVTDFTRKDEKIKRESFSLTRLFRDDDQMEHNRVKNSNRQEENKGPVVRRSISA